MATAQIQHNLRIMPFMIVKLFRQLTVTDGLIMPLMVQQKLKTRRRYSRTLQPLVSG